MISQLFFSFSLVLPLVAQTTTIENVSQQGEWLRAAVANATTFIPLDGQSGPITGKPMVANEVRHAEQVLADGSHISSSESERFYRDAFGRMRTETATGAVIFDPVAGFVYDLTAGRKTFSRKPISPNAKVTIAAAAHRSSISSHGKQSKPTPGAVVEELPAQFISGVYAKGVRTTITIPIGVMGNDHDLKVINERWYCDDLETLVRTYNSDPRFGRQTYELTDISQAPPSPALFQIPAGYTEDQ